jgi:hypothetical protein
VPRAVIGAATATERVGVAPGDDPGACRVVAANTDGQPGVAPPALDLVCQGP